MIRSAELIRSGACQTALAGGTDASLHPGLLASYRRLGVLAQPGDDPTGCCRPFDRTRTGFAVGEGAGVIVLEEWEHALSRGAQPLAEWVDGRLGGDPSGLTLVDASGGALAGLVRRLLAAAELPPEQISCVCVHGTGTELNDSAESAALRQILGSHASGIPVFGVKGALGHLMGAAGAVETAVSILAVRDQTFPGTANFRRADSGQGIHVQPETRNDVTISSLLKLSLGFGGQLAAGIIRSCE
jgi:3-oxoacyl-[acyl-carrier-protein] synthase II